MIQELRDAEWADVEHVCERLLVIAALAGESGLAEGWRATKRVGIGQHGSHGDIATASLNQLSADIERFKVWRRVVVADILELGISSNVADLRKAGHLLAGCRANRQPGKRELWTLEVLPAFKEHLIRDSLESAERIVRSEAMTIRAGDTTALSEAGSQCCALVIDREFEFRHNRGIGV